MTGRRFDGIEPFTTPGDLSTPNPAYFARADAMIRSLHRRRSSSSSTRSRPAVAWRPAGERGRRRLRVRPVPRTAIQERHEHRLVERERLPDVESPADDAVVLAVAKGIDRSTHRTSTPSLLDYLSSASLDDPRWRPVIELDAAYTYFATYAEVLKEYDREEFMPVFLAEAGYELEQNSSLDLVRRPGRRPTPRRTGASSGAAGQFYGNHYTWPFTRRVAEHTRHARQPPHCVT